MRKRSKTVYTTVREAAASSGLSERYLRDLLAAGRVTGAFKVGVSRRGVWLLPLPLVLDRSDRRKILKESARAS